MDSPVSSSFQTMKEIAWILKLLTMIFGVILLLFGVYIGVFGVAPPGRQLWITYRLVGLFALIQGVLYYFPNEFLCKSYRRVLIYMSITLLPSIMLLSALVVTILREDIESVLSRDFLFVIPVFLATLLAPTSLFIFYKQQESDSLESKVNKGVKSTFDS